MISFFRKIRRNLLNEGKTARYIKYAIGEILLVVIGILIALQINSWNQYRIDRNSERVYLQRIVSELETNIKVSERLILSRLEKKLYGLNQAKAFAEGQLAIEDPLKFVSNVTYGGVSSGGYYMGDDYVYDELVSTGNMKLLINDNIKNRVINYYAGIKSYETRLNTISSGFLSFINGIKPFDPENPDEISSYDLDEALLAFKTPEFRRMVDLEISYTYKLKEYTSKQFERATELIDVIEKKLGLNQD